jgi:glycosyltransferase involved in cell wall biosynthesis
VSTLPSEWGDGGARIVRATTVSLVSERKLAPAARAVQERDFGAELRLLTVGRLDPEKNPLLLAEIMSRLRTCERRWRLLVCGEGPMRGQLDARLAQLGVRDRVELLGYVPIDQGLLELYRTSHAFLHVSWTEAFPQVLVEAFAAGLSTVATAVGGVPAWASGAAILVEPGDADAAARTLELIATDSALRGRLIESGLQRSREGTLESASERLAAFLAAT